jgi:sulfate adenylyltransferase large subunit
VDDGKSTLIGRLLYDTKTIFEDQLEHVADVSKRRGDERTNLALLTDGLRAEREQGITIDVAYRYFSTPRRKFIIADAPGHIQYTRNMVTGASTANLAIVLVDARKGLVEQSRRHAFLASLLGIPHIVFAVNKMDLVDYEEAAYEKIKREFTDWAARLRVRDISFIPVSALNGDNVVEKSAKMPWYRGTPLLYHLETVHIASDRNLIDVRFPVQWVIRPQSTDHPDYRGYAGTVAGGILKPGDDIVALPSGFSSKVKRIETLDGDIAEAFPPMAVTVHLEDELDVSRGDMLCRPNNKPTVGQDLDAMVSWMVDRPLQKGGRYALKHTTRWVRAMVTEMQYRLDVNTLHRDEVATKLGLNDIGRIRLRTTAPIFYDAYDRNRTTGSFILVDETSNETVAAGMLKPLSL